MQVTRRPGVLSRRRTTLSAFWRRQTPPVRVDTEDAYRLWAPCYPPHAHNALMRVEEAIVTALLPPIHGCVAVDVGCGTGRYADILRARGARLAVGIDMSMAMLGAAGSRRHLLRAEARQLPLAGASVAVVVSGLALMDMESLDAVLAEMARVLEPGGIVVYSTLHPDGGRYGWTRTFDVDGVAYEMPAHWHPVAAHVDGCRRAGLVVEAVREEGLHGEQPSGPDMAPTHGAAPVVLVLRARRMPS